MNVRPIVLVALLGCSSDEERRGQAPPPESEPSTAPSSSARFEGVGQYLPHPMLAGWRQHGEVRYFDAENLFNYMNGASDGFIEYGFARLATTEYKPEATAGGSPRTVTLEVYDMGTPQGAFGKWSRIAGEQGDPAGLATRVVAIGGGALQGGADVVLWKGQYLVKLTYLDEDPNATEESMRAGSRDILPRMAREVAEKLSGPTDQPAAIRRFPTEGLIAHSPVFFARTVLGREGMGPGWRAWYDRGGKRIQLIRAGRTAWDVLSVGRGIVDIRGLGDEARTRSDDLLGMYVVARKGDDVVVAADPDLPDLPKADEAAKVALVREALGL